MSPPGVALGFFTRYAESEGALVDGDASGVLLVLPEELSRSLSLPEEVGLTEDPEAAREEGLVMVEAAHPLVRTAAKLVLDRGDVGYAQVLRPQAVPPTASDLERCARDQIYPAHGRIDIVDAPVALFVQVLRVGALLTYSVSINEQVQELEEAWVLADNGAVVPPALEDRLRSTAVEPGCPPGLVPFGAVAVRAADQILRARAQARSAELARQASKRLASQLSVVDDYYNRVLASIDDRKARANEARVSLLEDQAGATKTEWARRRREVAEDLTPTFDLRPFRMHVLALPTYHVKAQVCRGPRAYPLSLTYVPMISSFIAPRCPACEAEASLVAGKELLGCSECLTTQAPIGSGRPRLELVRPAAGALPGSPPIASLPSTAAAARPAPNASGQLQGGTTSPGSTEQAAVEPAPRPSPTPRSTPAARHSGRRKPSPGRVTPKGSSGDGSLSRTGYRLAVSLWESVLSNERFRARDVLAGSPLEALVRLYGPRGPGLVLALHDGEFPKALSAVTLPSETAGQAETAGELLTSLGREVRFAISWRSRPTTKLVEVQGLPLDRLGGLVIDNAGFGELLRRRLSDYLGPPPAPLITLEPEAAELLRRSASLAGLGYAARCMAAWWYVTSQTDRALPHRGDHAGIATSAAVETVVARRSGWRPSAAAAAARYDCSVAVVRNEVRRLQLIVRDCELGW